MSLLMDRFREVRGKSLKEVNVDYAFRSPWDLLNFYNGARVILPEEVGKSYYSLGIGEGTYAVFIGAPGAGKTTCLIQLGCHIIKPYAEGMIIFDDVENATSDQRIMNLTGWDYKTFKEKCSHRQEKLTIEEVFGNIEAIMKVKHSLRKELTVVSDKLDRDGKPITYLQPTVYIIDSLASMVSNKAGLSFDRYETMDDLKKGIPNKSKKKTGDDEEGSSDIAKAGMDETQAAKQLSTAFKKIIPFLKTYNIILLVINHINMKVAAGAKPWEIHQMLKPPLPYLNPGETLPGGNKPMYLANNLFRLDPGAKITEEKDSKFVGINGCMVNVKVIKSRSNKSGQVFELVYDQDTGFSNLFSNFNYLTENNCLKCASGRYSFPLYPDISCFTKKELKQRYFADKEFRQAFYSTLIMELKKQIYDPEHDEYRECVLANEDDNDEDIEIDIEKLKETDPSILEDEAIEEASTTETEDVLPESEDDVDAALENLGAETIMSPVPKLPKLKSARKKKAE